MNTHLLALQLMAAQGCLGADGAALQERAFPRFFKAASATG